MKRRNFVKKSSFAILSASFGIGVLGNCSNKKIPFKKNQRIGCIGDSVTYAGKNGYVELMQSFYDTKYPTYNLKFINLGLNSETITGLTEKNHPGPRPFLFNRLEKILDENNLDIIFFCYGINCGIYNPPSELVFEKYKEGIHTYLEEANKRNLQVVMLTPPPLASLEEGKHQLKNKEEHNIVSYSWENPYPKYDSEVVQKFRKIVLEMKHPSIISKIDIHTALTQNVEKAYGKDPIHPNRFGHQLIADTIVEALS